MKADRSKPRNRRQEYCFAVHPISLTFERDYTHNYVLYFEKDLHIFARYELNQKMIVKDKRFYFEVPASVQHHSFSSPEELQFKWSLYEERSLDNYTQEEYMESKKANLKWVYQVYDRYQKPVHTAQAIFGVIKLRLNFVFIVSTTCDTILTDLQLYYKENNIIPTKSKEKISKLSKGNSYQEGMLFSQTRQIEGIMREDSKLGVSNIHISSPIGTSYLFDSPKRTFESPVCYSSFEGQDHFGTREAKNSAGRSLIKLRRSQSDLKEYGVSSKRVTQNEEDRLLRSLSIPEEDESMDGKRDSFRSQNLHYTQVKAITSSQYFNEEGKLIIQPFYRQPKYWLIIFTILFIFVWVIGQGPKHTPQQSSSKRNHHHEPINKAGKKRQAPHSRLKDQPEKVTSGNIKERHRYEDKKVKNLDQDGQFQGKGSKRQEKLKSKKKDKKK